MKRTIVAASLVALTLTAQTFAGEKGGNGGGAFICQDPSQSEFLDLYEAKSNLGLQIINSNGSVEDQVQNALQKLSYDQDLYKAVVYEYGVVKSANVLPHPTNVSIAWPQDEKNRYAKKGCNSVGIMVFYDDIHAMDQDTESLNALPNTQQAAAWVHETIYKFLRDTRADGDSIPTRKVVAHLFAQESETDRKSALMASLLNQAHVFPTNLNHPAKSTFNLDMSNPKMGLSYRDSSGLIWGDLILDNNGKIQNMTELQADQFCKSIDARLPTEAELKRLKSRLTSFTTGYSALAWVDGMRIPTGSTDYTSQFQLAGDNAVLGLPHLVVNQCDPTIQTSSTGFCSLFWSAGSKNNSNVLGLSDYETNPGTLGGASGATLYTFGNDDNSATLNGVHNIPVTIGARCVMGK